MLLVTMYASEKSAMSVDAAARDLWSHRQVLAELRELLPLLGERVCHRVARLASHPDVPLLVHAQYSRNEILAALGTGDEGTAWWEVCLGIGSPCCVSAPTAARRSRRGRF
jgi:hypothetical protein